MKIIKRAAPLIAAALIAGKFPVLYVSAAGFAVPYEEAVSILRENMESRNEEFSVTVPYSAFDREVTMEELVGDALAETGKSTQGDYIRWSLQHFHCQAKLDTAKRTCEFTFTISYNTSAEEEEILDAKVSEIERQLNTAGLDNYGKIKAVFDYLVNNVSYISPGDDFKVFSAYGAAVEGNAVCQGYAQLMYRLLMDMDVPCRIISGTGNDSNHAWNIAEADGKFYYLDSTWDSSAAAEEYLFFMRGTDDFDELAGENSHTADEKPRSGLYDDFFSEEFMSTYPVANVRYDHDAEIHLNICDTNLDGIVDASDASDVLGAYARLSTGFTSGLNEISKKSADTNGDGIINAADASEILSYYAYLSTNDYISYEDYIKVK